MRIAVIGAGAMGSIYGGYSRGKKYFSCDLKQDVYHAQSAARRSD